MWVVRESGVVCVFTWEPKDFVEGGGTKLAGGSRIFWAGPGHLHFCCAIFLLSQSSFPRSSCPFDYWYFFFFSPL